MTKKKELSKQFKNRLESHIINLNIIRYQLFPIDFSGIYSRAKFKIFTLIKKNRLILKITINLYFYRKTPEYRRFFYFYSQNKWKDVERVLYTVPVEDRNHLFIKASRFINKDLNHDLIETYLEEVGDIPIRDILRVLETKVSITEATKTNNDLTENKFHHYFVMRDGGTHIALILTTTNKIHLITKIKRLNQINAKNSLELAFYRDLGTNFMEIASFVPSLVHQYFNQEHLVLSLEYIHGRKAQFSDLEKIKKISPNFHNLKYLQLKSSMTRKVFYFMIKNSRTTEKLSIKYTSDLISEIELRAEKKFPSQNIKQDILLLKSLFLKKNILMKLNIKRDLVLQHRELNPSHLRIDFNKDLKIIDWELYGLDFPGSDILNFILSFTIDFELIKTEVFDYLKSQNISNVELICNHLTLRYIGILLNNVEGTRIQENWSHAIDYLKKSPLYN